MLNNIPTLYILELDSSVVKSAKISIIFIGSPLKVMIENEPALNADISLNTKTKFRKKSEGLLQACISSRVNHYDFVALHSMWIIFLKGICVLVQVEIIHKSKF